MIQAIVSKDSHNNYKSFSCKGHADYDQSGKDIICSAVSMITINTINSIEQFTDCKFKGEMSNGNLFWEFIEEPDDKTVLLMDSLVLGLNQLQEENSNYIKLVIKEVP